MTIPSKRAKAFPGRADLGLRHPLLESGPVQVEVGRNFRPRHVLNSSMFINNEHRFDTASDVVREGLRLLEGREHEREAVIDELRREIEVASNKRRRGTFATGGPSSTSSEAVRQA